MKKKKKNKRRGGEWERNECVRRGEGRGGGGYFQHNLKKK
jgi:hypothetical protein